MRAIRFFFLFHKLIDLKLFSLVTTQGRRRRDLSQQIANDDGKVDLYMYRDSF